MHVHVPCACAQVIHKTLDPHWDESFEFTCPSLAVCVSRPLEVRIYDHDVSVLEAQLGKVSQAGMDAMPAPLARAKTLSSLSKPLSSSKALSNLAAIAGSPQGEARQGRHDKRHDSLGQVRVDLTKLLEQDSIECEPKLRLPPTGMRPQIAPLPVLLCV